MNFKKSDFFRKPESHKAVIEFREGIPSMKPTPGNNHLLQLGNQVSLNLDIGPILSGDPGSRGQVISLRQPVSWIALMVLAHPDLVHMHPAKPSP